MSVVSTVGDVILLPSALARGALHYYLRSNGSSNGARRSLATPHPHQQKHGTNMQQQLMHEDQLLPQQPPQQQEQQEEMEQQALALEQMVAAQAQALGLTVEQLEAHLADPGYPIATAVDEVERHLQLQQQQQVRYCAITSCYCVFYGLFSSYSW